MNKLDDAHPPQATRRIYYGWVLVPIAFVCYGLIFSPPYENWGFFAPEARKDLEISATEVGAIFGMFSLWYQAASPITSMLISRFGLRRTISGGASITALGMWLLSQAQTRFDCYVAYVFIMGTGVALSSVLPMQTLATFWFKRYRARAMALIMAGNTAFGAMLAPLNAYFAQNQGWRFAWMFYASISLAVAVVVAIFFRDRPQDLGLAPDGVPLEKDHSTTGDATQYLAPPPDGYPTRARDAILSNQFLLITLGGIAYVTAWSTFAAHGRLHMENFAFGAAVSAGVISMKNSMSTVGRLAAAVADFMPPHQLLAIALLAEGIGMVGFGYSETPAMATASSFLFGLGYGTSVVCISLTIAYVCGPALFVPTAGACRMIQGIVSAILPIVAGRIADQTGSYAWPFLGAGIIAAIGAVGVLFCRPLRALEKHSPAIEEPEQE